MSTLTEAQVAAEQAEYEAGLEPRDGDTDEPDETADQAGPETNTEGLFDRSQYDNPALALPKIEGQTVDRIRLKFAGTIDLDRSDPADVELFRKLAFGVAGAHTVMVEAVVKNTGGAMLAVTKEGEGQELVIAEKTLKIVTVYKPTPEEL